MRWLALLVVLCAGPAAAAPISLEDARARAQERSLDVALARWDVAAADGEAARWTGRALPSVAAFVSGTTGSGFTSFGFERPVASQIGAGVSGRFLLVDPSTWAAATAARRSVEGREATVDWTRIEARREATEFLARVVSELRVAEALARAAQDSGAEADAVTALVDAGLRPSADAARVRAQELDFVARAAEARGRAVAACSALQDRIGDEVTGTCEVTDLPLNPEPQEGAGEHPALTAARSAVDVSKASRSSTVAGLLPTVAVDGNVAHYTVPGRVGGLGWGVGFTVDIPVRIAELIGEVQVADAAEGRAEESLSGQTRALDATRVSAEGAWKAARSAVNARRGSLDAADAALRLVQERYRTGLSAVTDLLDTRSSRTDAAVGLRRAEASLWSALAALEAARGVR